VKSLASSIVALTLSASYFAGISTARQLVLWLETLPL
jgi:hypothetical protein